MKNVRLAIVGFGNVPLALLRYSGEPETKKKLAAAGARIAVTGIADFARGFAINKNGIPAETLLSLGRTERVDAFHAGPVPADNLDFIAKVPADILLVATPAKVPSREEIEAAFAKGMHVVTSNKTPVANFYAPLIREARRRSVQFRFGATVLAGYPPWKHFFDSVTDQDIRELRIVVNATSNQILTMMLDEGKGLEEGIAKAQELGIAERDPSDDIDGRDTQKKLVILANALMGANLVPDDVPTAGIRSVTRDDLERADRNGEWIHLLGRAWREGKTVRAEVKPASTGHPFFARLRGTSMGIYADAPAAGFGIRLDLGEGERALAATAAGVFEDILTIAKAG